ncbi:restriction endonuclease subunit S [Pseudoalteromonas sp. BSi20652]|uniref:restriction endonuclease subunit S n=1 Tax=Pseudoalteromonas sp. BSi20652 TaxID=388384 RepID=UPI0006ACC490|nr:restriction endonuclease subunit S [Pseudoalteromonas sp. BSi20652]
MSELPKGWITAKISDVTYKCTQSKPEDEVAIKYIDIGSINRQTKKIEKPQSLLGKNAPSRARKIVNTNDVLVSLTRPNLNAVTLVDEIFDKQFASTGFEVLKSLGIESRYLFALVRTNHFVNKISGTVQGALYPAAKSSDVQGYQFPLAPLNEQVRIADKLDSILAKVNKAQSRLDKIPVVLKRFRQSVLAAATSGELTKEWRGGSDNQWSNVKLKDVGKGFNYGSSAKSKPEGEVPVLRMGNLQGGQLDWEKLVYTSDEAEIEKYLLETGDVLFNRTNSPELVGKTSIYRGEQRAIYAGYLIRVKGGERLNTEFLNLQLNSPHARDYCWQVKTDGVSQSNINAKKLQAYEFDLPPMCEQLEIVRRVNELFARADLFERQYLDACKAFSRLTQSILAKAFRGELVEQEGNDEPASELLARILTKKEDNSSAKSKKESVSKVVNINSNDDRTAKNIDQASVRKWIGDLKEDTFRNEDLNESFGSDYEQLKEILFSLLKEDKPMITKVFDVAKKDFMFKKVQG